MAYVLLKEEDNNLFNISYRNCFDEHCNVDFIPTQYLKMASNHHREIIYRGKKIGAIQVAKSIAQKLEVPVQKQYIKRSNAVGDVVTKSFVRTSKRYNGRRKMQRTVPKGFVCSVCGTNKKLYLIARTVESNPEMASVFIWCDKCKLIASLINTKTRQLCPNVLSVFPDVVL